MVSIHSALIKVMVLGVTGSNTLAGILLEDGQSSVVEPYDVTGVVVGTARATLDRDDFGWIVE